MSDPSGDYRPFNDPHHPSWYSDRQPGQPGQQGQPDVSGSGSSAVPVQPQNPYAHHPLPGPQGGGQPPYPVQGMQSHGYVDRQPGQPHPYMGQARPSAVLGIISLVCGILAVVSFGMLLLPQLAAIVLGHIGYVKEPHARGLSIAGLVLGYLVSIGWVLLLVFGMSLAALSGV